jgi:hypothetical protein
VLAPYGSGKSEYLELLEKANIEKGQCARNGVWYIHPDDRSILITEADSITTVPSMNGWWRDNIIKNMYYSAVLDRLSAEVISLSKRYVVLSNYRIREPDAVVIIPEQDHKSNLTNNGKGKAGIQDWMMVSNIRNMYSEIYTDRIFKSIDEAVNPTVYRRGVYINVDFPDRIENVELEAERFIAILHNKTNIEIPDKVVNIIERRVKEATIRPRNLIISTYMKDGVEWHNLILTVKCKMVEALRSILAGCKLTGVVVEPHIVLFKTISYDDVLWAYDRVKDNFFEIPLVIEPKGVLYNL